MFGRHSPEQNSARRISPSEHSIRGPSPQDGEALQPSTPGSGHLAHTAMHVHLAQPWYYGAISREKAVNIITQCGLADG